MQALLNVIDRIEKIKIGKENTTSIKSKIYTLDKILNGGFAKGNLYVLAGKESVGKTAFLISLISNIISEREDFSRVGIIPINTSEERWVERIVSNVSEIWLEKIARGRLQEHEWQKLNEISGLKEFNKIEIASGYINIYELVNTCRVWISQKNVQIIFIDYLQLISVDDIKNKSLKIFAVCEALKKLSVELNIPIILSVLIKPNKKLFSDLKDLRKIGSIEPFADVIMFLNKPNYDTSQNEKSKQKIHLSVKKNNTGQLDTIKLKAIMQIQKLVEFDD